MTLVTLPRAGLPLDDAGNRMDREWYRWAYDITQRVGGVAGMSADESLLMAGVCDISDIKARIEEISNLAPPRFDEAPMPQQDTGPILRPDVEFLLQVAARLTSANVFTRAQTVTPVALTDAATINTDAAASNTFTVTLAGNRTLANPTGLQDGVIVNWFFKQDATGSRTLAFGTAFKWAGGTAPTLTTTASGVDMVTGQFIASLGIIAAVFVKGFA